jgi:hypothetical protein
MGAHITKKEGRVARACMQCIHLKGAQAPLSHDCVTTGQVCVLLTLMGVAWRCGCNYRRAPSGHPASDSARNNKGM